MSLLLEALLAASEKAANVARRCRGDEHLFGLLVQRKGAGEGNPRFVEDFKTLADVLIQEAVKRDVALRFPELADSIKGEESNVFENKLGESVVVEIRGSKEETASLLKTVLSGDETAAQRLSAEVHRNVSLLEVDTSAVPEFDIDAGSLGIWIDPIDSTSEYINAIESLSDEGIYVSGLRCANVLIGAYDKATGVPVVGVINQPFSLLEHEGWSGKCFWGVHTPHLSATSALPPFEPTNRIALSSTETDDVKAKLRRAGYTLVEAAGAGHKILAVIRGLCDAYVLSKGTTFEWDTCGPHAILKALGGGVVEFGAATEGAVRELVYGARDECGSKMARCCNAGGIIAYRSEGVLRRLLEVV